MNVKLGVKKKKRILEYIKWFSIFLLIFFLIIENYFFNVHIWYVRILFLLFTIFMLSLLFICTDKGKRAISFFYESKLEMYKVVWPTLKKTFYTTLIVLVVTLLLSLILWCLDTIFIYFVSFFTRLRF
ncbi:preprotein translocase subunit SecE [Candidatus Purcelliella pentastirinorum]|uniref:Protein translocase subunit SecE n=1 Tax=Candidatus Purcelliella pentastirinorum TaxID=472834 RepID=A0A346DZZ6_9ENTR|nr:preprotein translocase subunit SecE [Candidatus Purcelliella pentastirinorum]AXN02301.1 Preprotein translocase subunit SecE [Candidatus Purcelliella pentastirinorum]WDI78851.1 preprotein translocase subunit SecE [Candidatus Purcelliella pentastirinorum]WDR79984.1 preprotein translocase subunit SecE [Candidatus Purcelliella pentastirinorum]